MKHPEIDEEAVVDRYVAGKLSAAECERFEAHFLNCPACIQGIEDAERLQRGLSLAAAEDVVARQTILSVAWHAVRSRTGLAMAAAMLVMGLIPASFLWQRAGRLGADLDAARRALAEERRPRLNTPILALVATRAGEQPLQQISLRTEPEWIVLAVELGDTARPRYEVSLTAADGTVITESPDLEPSFRGTVTVSLHSSLLPAGDYRLRVASDGQQLEFPLRVVTF